MRVVLAERIQMKLCASIPWAPVDSKPIGMKEMPLAVAAAVYLCILLFSAAVTLASGLLAGVLVDIYRALDRG